MPLVCRPLSVNSYALNKVWFRTHSVDLRAGDMATLAKLCKSYIYQDMLEKPNELVPYQKVQQGGLGLHNIKCKALASLISTFLYELPTILVLATDLFLIWQNKLNKKGTTLYQIRSEIECLVCLLRRSRSKFLREAGEKY